MLLLALVVELAIISLAKKKVNVPGAKRLVVVNVDGLLCLGLLGGHLGLLGGHLGLLKLWLLGGHLGLLSDNHSLLCLVITILRLYDRRIVARMKMAALVTK
jgi:hypothetical protein